ncbi:YjcZ family sporulation protein [Brevibacillus ginsengisoli]
MSTSSFCNNIGGCFGLILVLFILLVIVGASDE